MHFRQSVDPARTSRSTLVSAAALLFAVQGAFAANYTYTNGDANGLWDITSANWTTGAGNTQWVNDPTNPNAAIFANASAPVGTVTVSGTTTATPILVSGITFAEGGWTIAGGFLQASTPTGPGTLVFNNTLGSGTNTISSVIQNTSPTVAGATTAVTFNGPGTYVLTGVNTYTGTTTVNGTSTAGTVGNTIVQVSNTGPGPSVNINHSANPIILNGGTLKGGVTYIGGSLIQIGNNGATIDTNAGTVNLNATLSDAPSSSNGGLIRTGGGVFNWGGSSTFSGGFINQGSTVFLNSAQNYTGPTTTSGQIRLTAGGTGNVLPTTTVLNLATGGQLHLLGHNQTLAGLNTVGGTTLGQSNGSGWGGVTGSTLTVDGPGTLNAPITEGGTLNGLANALGGGYTALRKTGTGVLQLNSNSRFGGGTTIDGGTVKMGVARALGGYGFFVSGQTPGSTSVNTGGTLDLNGTSPWLPIKLNGGTLANSNATNSTVRNGIYALGYSGASSDFQVPANPMGITVDAGGNSAVRGYYGLSTASVNIDNGGLGYTSAPTITFTGGSYQNAIATGNIDGNGTITSLTFTRPGQGYNNAPSAVTINGGGTPTSAPTFSYNNAFTLEATQISDPGNNYTAVPTVTFAAGTATTTPIMSGVQLDSDSFIGDNFGAINLQFVVRGTGGFTKVGTNTVALNNLSNTYAGNTTVSDGTLLFNNGTTVSPLITLNGGTLGGTGVLAGNVAAGSGAHTIAPSATLGTTTATTLTMAGLTTNATTTMRFNLQTGFTGDRIKVTGLNALSLNGGTVEISNAPVGPTSLGWYNVIEHNGFTGSVAGITMPATVNSIAYTIDSSDPVFIRVHRGFMGDANDDGTVNFSDFIILSQNFGQSGNWNQANFTGAAVIDFNDFVVLSQNFGNTIGAGQLTVSNEEIALFHSASQSFFAGLGIPEPTSLALLGLGAVAMLRRRRTP
jgi:autotransporter-associated beta strand protein